jgi:uncharacterized Zn finger protein (UPF0148 family)
VVSLAGGDGMKAYDHQYITEYLMDGYEGYDPEEECPHCGVMIVPEVDYDDVVFCPECHMIIWEPEPEAPQGVDEEEVPL